MSDEKPTFTVEEVDSVAPAPRARVEDVPVPPAERKRDYLDGFLAEKPQGASAGEFFI